MGAAIAPMFQIALWSVPPRDAGSASGAMQSFQQIGSALGIADHRADILCLAGGRFAVGLGAAPAFVDSMSAALFYEMAAFALVAQHGVLPQPARATPGAGQGGRGQPGRRRELEPATHCSIRGELRPAVWPKRERASLEALSRKSAEMSLWIPITIAAAFLQNVRSALQKHLKGVMGTTGATFVRFGYGFPFALRSCSSSTASRHIRSRPPTRVS